MKIRYPGERDLNGGASYTVVGGVNFIEFPSSLTGVPARIIALVGKWFPTGAHKVGASFGCLAPHLVTGQFDPATQKAVWPSTGNYCRGGAYNSHLIGCESIAILPEGKDPNEVTADEVRAAFYKSVALTPASATRLKLTYGRK